MPPKKKTTTTVGTRTVSAAILRTANSSPSPGVSRRAKLPVLVSNLVEMWEQRELSLGTVLLFWDLLGVMKPMRRPARLALFVR